MKNRLLYGWTITRGFYLLMGLAIIISSASAKDWLSISIGAYFASMGLFAFGCAGGHCITNSTSANEETKEVEWEEVKK
jgi:myo-inositol-hexaphosphate 3-phosphohydrolase